ncbi:LysR family transcriptional regulator [Polaromonas sp. OV174]|uniref:LysR family transcriptional regulator n=1 Tax=Polaromonas sp. OV174 TaxID=1855300 RepID=UPI001C4311C5
MDKFLEMQTFAAVVDAGSFVRAAQALDISKAAVSRYVADLEEPLGVRLLHRTTRKLSLTEEGRAFHVRCKALLSELEEAESEITASSAQASGLVKINVPVSFGIMHLALGTWHLALGTWHLALGTWGDLHPRKIQS